MIVLDDWLLGVYNKMSHKIQILFGINNFTQAKIFVVAVLLLRVYQALAVWMNNPEVSFRMIVVIEGMHMLFFIFELAVVLWSEGKYKRQDKIYINNAVVYLRYSRYMFILFTFRDVYYVLYEGGGVLGFVAEVLIFSALYLICCTPLPPSKSKVRVFLEGFFSGKDNKVFRPS